MIQVIKKQQFSFFQLLNKSASIRGFFLNHYVNEWRSYITEMAKMIDQGELQSFVDRGDRYQQGPFIGLDKIVDAVDVRCILISQFLFPRDKQLGTY